MPQIGWFEILIIIVLIILIVGPKDFPIVIRKLGRWIGNIKKYFRDIQSSVSELEEDIESQVSLTDDKSIKTKKVKNKDEK
tara:strand:+ start:49 stop:291 length:243 start_codon:yes stop_codon:yes gene_type:complete